MTKIQEFKGHTARVSLLVIHLSYVPVLSTRLKMDFSFNTHIISPLI